MAKNKTANQPKFTYEQMLARRAEILEQSPWLADYEVEALLADEGYPSINDVPEGFVMPQEQEESGLEMAGFKVVKRSEIAAMTAEEEQSEDDYELEDQEKDDSFDITNISSKEAELRIKARNLLKKNIAAETNKMGVAMIVFVVAQLGISAVIAAYLMIIAGYKIPEINAYLSTPLNMLFIQGIIMVVGLGLPFILYTYFLRIPIVELVPFQSVRTMDLLRMTALGVGFSAVIHYITNVIDKGTLKTGGLSDSQMSLADSKGIGLLVSIIVLCILPAVLEEFVFRGVVISVLRRKGGDLFAMVLSAVFCALVYSNQQGIGGFAIFLLLGYFVLLSGSLLPAIIINLLNKALALTVTLLGTIVAPERVVIIDMAATLMLIIIACVTVPSLVSRYPDLFKIRQGNSSLTMGEKLRVGITRPTILLLVLYAVFFAVLEMVPIETLLENLI